MPLLQHGWPRAPSPVAEDLPLDQGATAVVAHGTTAADGTRRTGRRATAAVAYGMTPAGGTMADMARRSTTTTSRSHGAGGAPPEDFEENIVDIDVAEEMRGSYLE